MKDNAMNRFSRLNTILYTFVLVAGVYIGSTASADTSVWEVTSAGNTIYLGGTVHLLRPSDYPLPEEYEQVIRHPRRSILKQT